MSAFGVDVQFGGDVVFAQGVVEAGANVWRGYGVFLAVDYEHGGQVFGGLGLFLEMWLDPWIDQEGEVGVSLLVLLGGVKAER